MTTDFGTDLASTDEVDETRIMSGVELVAWDSVWRLKTPRSIGILAADSPEYGLDLLEAIGAADTPSKRAALPGLIRAQLKNDERILTVESTITRVVDGPSTEYAISIDCETEEGPFSLVGLAGDAELDLAVKLLPGGV